MTAFAELVLYASLRISLVAAGVALTLVAARVRSGAVRHSAWVAVLGAMFLMPILPYCVPAVAISLPAASRVTEIIPAVAAAPIPSGDREIAAPVAGQLAEAPLPQTPRRRSVDWTWVVFAVYGLVAVALLVRLVVGWRSARRLARESTPVPELSNERATYESRLIAVPLTIGVFAPRITLPMGWRDWPDGKLRAVLAHERAHVQRRDALIGLLAQLNRCVFWFHPLAWWLERKLAATAEHACDDAGICAMGEPRRYAEILLDLAETVRSSGRRYSWQGIGMDGAGLLGQRIDRILSGDLRSVSPGRKAMVAVGCVVAIVLAAGCRQKSHVTAWEDNPQRAKIQADMKHMREVLDDMTIRSAGEHMTAQQALDLETALQKNPDDLNSRKKLLAFYADSGEKTIGAEKSIAARRPHILWLIQHHPEDRMVIYAEAAISPTGLDRLPDPAGYAQAKKLWLAQTASPSTSPAILANAAAFLKVADKPIAEQLLVRAQALDPKGRWSVQLGRLYYEVLVGSNALMPQGVVRSVSRADMDGAYAAEVREKLAKSNDPDLLAATGDMLVIRGRGLYAQKNIDFDPAALAKSYLTRAIELNPQSHDAHRDLDLLRRLDRDKPLQDAIRANQGQQYAASLPEVQRFPALAQLAETAYWPVEYQHTRGSSPPVQKAAAERGQLTESETKAHLDAARRYAEESLQLASKFPNDPDYGATVYKDNMLLGMVAMQEGNRRAAVAYLLAASHAPRNEELAYSMEAFTFALPAWLLKDGEKAKVIEFLERFAETDVSQKSYLLESAKRIRDGKKPLWYRE